MLILNATYGQIYSFENCNAFDSNLLHLKLDTNSFWEIGKPTKLNFNNSYSGDFSIVTGLDSMYKESDTSMFIVSFYEDFDVWVPNYLGIYCPLVIEFDHRFITDSISDYGKIEMSLDNGSKWYDVLSSKFNANGLCDITENPKNYHYFESTGDTIFDSLSVYGNSNGWVHSIFSKNVEQIVNIDNVYPDSVMIRFTFITDSIGRNEGWQIDNLCLSMDRISNIKEINNVQSLKIIPNPNNGTFIIEDIDIQNGIIEIFDLTGVVVFSEKIHSQRKQTVITELNSGMYIVKVGDGKTIQISKVYVQ